LEGFDNTPESWQSLLAKWYEDGSPLKIICTLKEPIETNVSEYFTEDNLIEIRGGGRLTFLNEYNIEVPSVIIY
jgi:hypothetical protein